MKNKVGFIATVIYTVLTAVVLTVVLCSAFLGAHWPPMWLWITALIIKSVALFIGLNWIFTKPDTSYTDEARRIDVLTEISKQYNVTIITATQQKIEP